jgi:hypothetical protein
MLRKTCALQAAPALTAVAAAKPWRLGGPRNFAADSGIRPKWRSALRNMPPADCGWARTERSKGQ